MGIALFKLENCRLLRAVQRQQPCRSGRICGTGITGTGEDVHVSSCSGIPSSELRRRAAAAAASPLKPKIGLRSGDGIFFDKFLNCFSLVMRPFVVPLGRLSLRARGHHQAFVTSGLPRVSSCTLFPSCRTFFCFE